MKLEKVIRRQIDLKIREHAICLLWQNQPVIYSLPMARMKRIVVPGYPHHVIQSGVRSMDVFFTEEDGADDLKILKELFGV